MFNFQNFSEQLDRIETNIEEGIKKQKEILWEKNRKRDLAIASKINYEFNNAVKVVGNRLTIKKSHETYYSFNFRGIKTYYTCRIYANNIENLKWEISESAGHVGYYSKDIILGDLGKILVSWVTENLKKDNLILKGGVKWLHKN